MLFKRAIQITTIALVATSLTACFGGKKKVGDSAMGADTETTTSIGSVMDSFYGEGHSNAENKGNVNQRVVYFDFDSSDVHSEDAKNLQAHAKYLLENPTLNLRVSGHTDSRGSREYNVGLGERRASAVSRYLEMRGVPSNRLVIISYGKEQPAALGDTESAWSQNRRAELDYETN